MLSEDATATESRVSGCDRHASCSLYAECIVVSTSRNGSGTVRAGYSTRERACVAWFVQIGLLSLFFIRWPIAPFAWRSTFESTGCNQLEVSCIAVQRSPLHVPLRFSLRMPAGALRNLRGPLYLSWSAHATLCLSLSTDYEVATCSCETSESGPVYHHLRSAL